MAGKAKVLSIAGDRISEIVKNPMAFLTELPLGEYSVTECEEKEKYNAKKDDKHPTYYAIAIVNKKTGATYSFSDFYLSAIWVKPDGKNKVKVTDTLVKGKDLFFVDKFVIEKLMKPKKDDRKYPVSFYEQYIDKQDEMNSLLKEKKYGLYNRIKRDIIANSSLLPEKADMYERQIVVDSFFKPQV